MSINSFQNFAGVRMDGLNYVTKHATPPSVTHTNLSSTARVQASKAFNTSLSKASSFAIQYVRMSDYQGSLNNDCHVYGVEDHEDVRYIVVNSGSIVWVESARSLKEVDEDERQDDVDYPSEHIDTYVNELTDDIVDAITSAWEDIEEFESEIKKNAHKDVKEVEEVSEVVEEVSDVEEEQVEDDEEEIPLPKSIVGITHHAESRIRQRFPLTAKFSKDKIKRMFRNVHKRAHFVGLDNTVTDEQRNEAGERYEFVSYLDGVKYILSGNGYLITVMSTVDISVLADFEEDFTDVLADMNSRIHKLHTDGTEAVEDIANKGRSEILLKQFNIERELIDLKEGIMRSVLAGEEDSEGRTEMIARINLLEDELESVKEQDTKLRGDAVNLGKYLNTYVDFRKVLAWEK